MQEGIAKTDRHGFDIYHGIADVKSLWLKYCKQYEPRLRALVPTFRVTPVVEDESTDVMVAGFIIEPKQKGTAKKGSIKVQLQFLQNHKELYTELHRDFSKIEYAPQSEAQLQNFKTLLLLETALLMGTDLEWASGGVAAACAETVLDSGGAGDDGDKSDADADTGTSAGAGIDVNVNAAGAPSVRASAPSVPRRTATAAAAAAAASSANDGGAAGTDDSAAPAPGLAAGPSPDGGAAPTDADATVLDVNDFTTWLPETFALVPLDKIPFPTDPNTSICSVRSYLAVAMILWYDTEIRAAHSKVWDTLQYSWHDGMAAVLMARYLSHGPQRCWFRKMANYGSTRIQRAGMYLVDRDTPVPEETGVA